ncbi:MAG TPA: nucleoside deaminase [Terriglobia bacterium]|nr:nucleoside deaminase [Terriglobia bacterium]
MQEQWMREAIALSVRNVRTGQGGPFAALVVRNGAVIAREVNRVTVLNDPTAHAEVLAIRAACETLRSFQLAGCELYTTCEPCPMCLGAIYWARIARFYYGNTRSDAAAIGFDDSLIYDEIGKLPEKRRIPGVRLLANEAAEAFVEWTRSGSKVLY